MKGSSKRFSCTRHATENTIYNHKKINLKKNYTWSCYTNSSSTSTNKLGSWVNISGHCRCLKSPTELYLKKLIFVNTSHYLLDSNYKVLILTRLIFVLGDVCVLLFCDNTTLLFTKALEIGLRFRYVFVPVMSWKIIKKTLMRDSVCTFHLISSHVKCLWICIFCKFW